MYDEFFGIEESEQYAFYRVPKLLFTSERFWNLSTDAKMLYGLLLDRMALSQKNGWVDEQGRVYIIYTVENIMESLGCGNKKAIQLLAELENKANLILRKKQGLGKPNLIYVKKFTVAARAVERHFLKCENDTSGNVETTSLGVSKEHGNNTDKNNTEFNDTDPFLPSGFCGKEPDGTDEFTRYEDICKERMWNLNAEGVWPFNFTKIGRYWDSKDEIDIVALDPEGKNLILGECKYWTEPVGLGVLHNLEAKTDSVAWEQKNRKVWYVLFSASGFTDELKALAQTREDLLLCSED